MLDRLPGMAKLLVKRPEIELGLRHPRPQRQCALETVGGFNVTAARSEHAAKIAVRFRARRRRLGRAVEKLLCRFELALVGMNNCQVLQGRQIFGLCFQYAPEE